jgi:hypothetical protein
MLSTTGNGRKGRTFMSLNTWLLVFAAVVLPAGSWAALPEARIETEYQALKY